MRATLDISEFKILGEQVIRLGKKASRCIKNLERTSFRHYFTFERKKKTTEKNLWWELPALVSLSAEALSLYDLEVPRLSQTQSR